jgi:sugar porter (SP) family MFS transporter
MRRSLYLYSFVAALGGFLFGFDTAVINGALPFFRDYFNLDSTMEGWAVSSALIGCIVGAIAIGRPSDKFGRKQMLKLTGILFLVSAAGSGLATDVFTFIVFRVIGGLAVGGASVLSPMYISEIAPAKYRGRFAISFQLAIVVGILVAFGSDYLLMNTGQNNWRWMFLAEVVPALTFYILLFFVAKSPRWLVKSGQLDQAKSVIEKVNPNSDSSKLLEEINLSINNELVDHIKYLFKKPYLRLVIVGIMVGMFNQFTGINIVMYYSSDIFLSANFSAYSALGQSVLVGLVNLVFTILALTLIDKIGRKIMLLMGSLGMAIFLGGFAYSFLFDIKGLLLLIMLLGFVAFFAFSQGAVIWVLFSEMFPNNIRARGAAIGSFSHWFFNGLTTFMFPILSRSFESGNGTGYIFGFYAIVTFMSFFYFKKFIVEAKGKTLEELEKEVLK